MLFSHPSHLLKIANHTGKIKLALDTAPFICSSIGWNLPVPGASPQKAEHTAEMLTSTEWLSKEACTLEVISDMTALSTPSSPSEIPSSCQGQHRTAHGFCAHCQWQRLLQRAYHWYVFCLYCLFTSPAMASTAVIAPLFMRTGQSSPLHSTWIDTMDSSDLHVSLVCTRFRAPQH